MVKVVSSPLTKEFSRLRGWLVGLGVGVLFVGVLSLIPDLIHQHEWVVWGAVFLGSWLGVRAWEYPNPVGRLKQDLRRFIKVALVLAGIVLALVFLPDLIESMVNSLIPTDLPGLARMTLCGFVALSWMLVMISRRIDRLNR